MSLLLDLLTFPVTLPAKGLLALAEQLRQQAEQELGQDRGSIQTRLLELEIRREIGDLSEDDYQARETALLSQLEAALEHREGAAA